MNNYEDIQNQIKELVKLRNEIYSKTNIEIQSCDNKIKELREELEKFHAKDRITEVLNKLNEDLSGCLNELIAGELSDTWYRLPKSIKSEYYKKELTDDNNYNHLITYLGSEMSESTDRYIKEITDWFTKKFLEIDTP